jgi:hypothetical protein
MIADFPELETTCQACKGSDSNYDHEADAWLDCKQCDGAGFTPTATGILVLELVRHNAKLDINAQLRISSRAAS